MRRSLLLSLAALTGLMVTMMPGIKIGNYKLTTDKDGKQRISEDFAANNAKLSVNKRIAKRKGSAKKVKVAKPVLRIPGKGRGE